MIGNKKAGLFVDSRYTLQAPIETDTKLVAVFETGQGAIDARVGDFIPKGGKLGFDPWLHTPGEIKDLSEKLAGKALKHLGALGFETRVLPSTSPAHAAMGLRAHLGGGDDLTECGAVRAKHHTVVGCGKFS